MDTEVWRYTYVCMYLYIDTCIYYTGIDIYLLKCHSIVVWLLLFLIEICFNSDCCSTV